MLRLKSEEARVKRQRIAHYLITGKACLRARIELASHKVVIREAHEGGGGESHLIFISSLGLVPETILHYACIAL